jgi:hypothetical protein
MLIGISALLVLPEMQTAATAADLATLFQEARTTASQLRKDAATMETYTRSNLSWQSHGSQITEIRQHINKAGSILSEMQAARADAQSWHQEAIDRITPVLNELASNTEAVIRQLNENPGRLKTPTYQGYLKDNADLAVELANIVGDAVNADNIRTKIETMQAKLGQ